LPDCMSVEIPKLKKPTVNGNFFRTYAIAISPEMETELKNLKKEHNPRVINDWLRALWQLGLNAHRDSKSV
jgi:hypothetical protein